MAFKRPNMIKQAGASGAVDETAFYDAFEQVPSLYVRSSRELAEYIDSIKTGLSLHAEEWEKRIEQLKRLRSIILAGASEFDEFVAFLRELENPLQSCISDLRSQVVREACITVAFVSFKLALKVDRFLEPLLCSLIDLIQNSVKIMSSCGIVSLKFIIRFTPSQRFFPIFAKEMSTKSNITRRYLCELLALMCSEWPNQYLEKNSSIIQEWFKKGINDADQDARSISRQAFIVFYSKFPDHGNQVLNSIEPSKRRLIEKEFSNANVPLTVSNETASKGRFVVPSMPPKIMSESMNSSCVSPVRDIVTPPVYDATSYARARPSVNSSTMDRKTRTSKVGTFSQPTSREVSPTRSIGGTTAQPSNTSAHYRTNSIRVRGTGPPSTRTRLPNYNTTQGRTSTVRVAPRSQGASREGSPDRTGSTLPEPWNAMMGSSYGGNVYRSRQNSQEESGYRGRATSEQPTEQNMTDSLSRTRRLLSAAGDNGGDSDDNVSEISSSASDAPFSGQPTRMATEVTDMIRLLQGSHWRDRRDGLLNFQIHLESGGPLSRGEMQKISELFSRLLNDTKGKVFMTLLYTIQLFVKEYFSYLFQWLYVLLIRLMTKQGNDSLSSHQEYIQETLNVVRTNFPKNLQFSYCCKYLQDPTQTPNLKTKNCILQYMHLLLFQCEADEIYMDSNSDTVMAFAKIINYTMEPKSPEVRKNAEEVLWRLFDLDPPRWNRVVSSLGKSFQENAMRVVHRHMPGGVPAENGASLDNMSCNSSPASLGISSSIPTSPSSIGSHIPAPRNAMPDNKRGGGTAPTVVSTATALQRTGIPQRSSVSPLNTRMADPSSGSSTPILGILKPSRVSGNGGTDGTSPPSSANENVDQVDTQKISPEDITVFIRQTTENIQSLSRGCRQMGPSALETSVASGVENERHITNGADVHSVDSGIHSLAGDGSSHLHSISNVTTHLTPATYDMPEHSTQQQQQQQPNTQIPRQPNNQQPSQLRYDPLHYQMQSPSLIPSQAAPVLDVHRSRMKKSALIGYNTLKRIREMPPDDVLGEILQELSNHNERHEQRKLCMTKLSRLIKEGAVEDWNEHFKTTLFLLLEILGDSESELRAQSLRVLQHLMLAEPRRFEEYAHLTIMKILESQKDDEKSVSAAADECSKVLPEILPSQLLFSVLHPVILDSETRIMTAAIKMLQYLFGVTEASVVWDIFLQVAPALVKGCHSAISEIRKCSIFCLVEVHTRAGENTMIHLKSLGLKSDKMRLLQLFINRRCEAEGGTTIPLSTGVSNV